MQRLQLHREEKKRKQELALSERIDKYNEEYIEALFSHEKFTNGLCWKTKQEVDQGLEVMS